MQTIRMNGTLNCKMPPRKKGVFHENEKSINLLRNQEVHMSSMLLSKYLHFHPGTDYIFIIF